MEPLLARTDRPAQPFSIGNWAYESYLTSVHKLYNLFKLCHLNLVGGIIGTLLVEPCAGYRAGQLMDLSLDRSRFTNVNPESIPPHLQGRSIIVLLHGDKSKVGLFAPMIQAINSAHEDKPIFAFNIDVPNGVMKRNRGHVPIVVTQLRNEVLALYPDGQIPHINFVGHSSGGDFIQPIIAQLRNEGVHFSFTAIKIGSLTKAKNPESKANKLALFDTTARGVYYEIAGTRDALEGRISIFPRERQFHVDAGHIGLLFSSRTHEHVNQLIT